MEAQSYHCALSGRRLEPETAALDHIVPHSEGGEHEIGNVQWVKSEVNNAKGTMSQDEFVRMCVDVAIHSGGCDMPSGKVDWMDSSLIYNG